MALYEIKVRTNFSAAHNLRDYHGKCEHLHGHNWIVEATFAFAALEKSGMAIDFKIAKELLKEAVESFDHAYLNEVPFFKKSNPTSENIAKFIYDTIKKQNRNIAAIAVWEAEGSCAVYREA